MINPNSELSRRQFVRRSVFGALGSAVVADLFSFSSKAAETARLSSSPQIVVFTKAYQVLGLNFEESAAITAEAQLSGVDTPVRPKGEVEPDRVAEDLPRYAEALRKRNLSMPLLTTAVTSISSPFAEQIVRTAKRLGVQFYRLGFIDRESDVSNQIREVRARLKDVAALSRQEGITALLQNHSPSGHAYLGGDLTDLRALVEDFDPAEIGVAFDIGHALIVHKDRWREHFEQIKPHLKVIYIKDASMNGRWVPFGQGDVGKSGYFKLLRELNYHAPISLHLEYDWQENGKRKNRDGLLTALKESSAVVKRWLNS